MHCLAEVPKTPSYPCVKPNLDPSAIPRRTSGPMRTMATHQVLHLQVQSRAPGSLNLDKAVIKARDPSIARPLAQVNRPYLLNSLYV